MRKPEFAGRTETGCGKVAFDDKTLLYLDPVRREWTVESGCKPLKEKDLGPKLVVDQIWGDGVEVVVDGERTLWWWNPHEDNFLTEPRYVTRGREAHDQLPPPVGRKL